MQWKRLLTTNQIIIFSVNIAWACFIPARIFHVCFCTSLILNVFFPCMFRYLSDEPPIQRFPVKGATLPSLPGLPHSCSLASFQKTRRGAEMVSGLSGAQQQTGICGHPHSWSPLVGWSWQARTDTSEEGRGMHTDLTQLRTRLRHHRTID